MARGNTKHWRVTALSRPTTHDCLCLTPCVWWNVAYVWLQRTKQPHLRTCPDDQRGSLIYKLRESDNDPVPHWRLSSVCDARPTTIRNQLEQCPSCVCWDWHRLYLHLHKLIGCREDAGSTEKRLSTFFPDATSSNIKFMEHVLLETIDT